MEDLELGGLLGAGGFADVFEANEHHLGRRVAVKIFRTRVDGMDEKSFVREAQAMGKLSGVRNVVQVYRSGLTDDNHPFLVMERMEYTLAALAGSEDVALEDSVRVGVLTSRALQIAHEAGILHRDLKPANILVDRYGEPALSDFGISSLLRSEDSSSIYAFSADHAAPELFEEARSTPASDVYSLGATLFTLIEGRPPFERRPDEGPMSFMTRVMNEPAPHSIRAAKHLPGLDSILQAAMAKEPGERPALAEFTDDLAALSTDHAANTGTPRLPAEAPSAVRSHNDRTIVGRGAEELSSTDVDPPEESSAGESPAEQPDPSGSPDSERARSRRLLLAALALVVAAAATVGVVAIMPGTEAGVEATAPAPNGAGSPEDTDSPTLEADIEGLDGVENVRPLDAGGVRETSGQLRQSLDEFAASSEIAAIQAGMPIEDQTGGALGFGDLPSLVDYGGINKLSSPNCYRLELHDLEVLGGARSVWTDGTTFNILFAVEFGTPEQAYGYYVATALFTGTPSDQCEGWPESGNAVDSDKVRVDRTDFELASDEDELFTSVHTDAAEIGFDADIVYSALAQKGSLVLLAISGQISGTSDPGSHRSNLDEMLAAF